MNRYVIGIDTGGTFTDGALLHYRTRKVISSAKTLTTRNDLKIGVINVLKKLKISDDYDIRLVGISSTLATNSVAEGKARRVGLILIGYDRGLVEDYNMQENLAASEVGYFDGGHNAQGAEKKPLDEEGIKKWVETYQHEVDAIAISSYFSPLNPDHEERAFEIIQEMTSLPVVMGHQLSTKINSIKRAGTASINASLVAVMHDFIGAVRKSLKEMKINATLMIVRGDGTLMPYEEAIQKPVDTVMSGPAASAIGGRFLSKKNNALVIDVGSTTTDMALVENARVVVSEEGARVGDTQTAVEAASIRTISLGCDSKITLDDYYNLVIGPQKVTPLSQLAIRFEHVANELYDLKNRTNMGIRLTEIEYWNLYRPPEDHVYKLLSGNHKKIIDFLRDGPKRLSQVVKALDVYHPGHLQCENLLQQGYIEISTLTPSDILHIDGNMNMWDTRAAEAALDYVCHFPKLKKSRFIRQSIEHIINVIVEEIIIFLACQDNKTSEMPTRIDGEWGRWMLRETLRGQNDFLAVNLDSRVPIIGTGAPAEYFVKQAAKIVNAHFILPEFSEVANAIGAISGSLMEIKEAIVFVRQSEDKHTYMVQFGKEKFEIEDFEEACEFAEDKVKDKARKAVIHAGAEDPYVEVKVKKEGSLQRYIARAVGNPKISEKQQIPSL